MKVALQSFAGGSFRRWFSWFRAHAVMIWLVSLPFLLVYGGIQQWPEIQNVVVTLRGADPNWLLFGIGIEGLILLSPALTYRVILRRLGHCLPFPSLVWMHLQRIVVGTLAPASGPVSVVVFIRALNRRSVTTHDALTMLAMRSVATQGAFVLLLLGAVALRGPIHAVIVLVAALVLMAAVVPLVKRAKVPACLGPWSWRRRLPRSIAKRMMTFSTRFRSHRIALSDLSGPLIITLVSRLGGIFLLLVSVRAMGVDVSPKAIGMVIMAEIIARVAVPVFNGIGVVEAATALALQQSGLPAAAAISVALLWRAFEFWLPLTIALVSQAAILIPALGSGTTKASTRSITPESEGALLLPRRRLVTVAASTAGVMASRRAVSGTRDAS